MKRITVIIISLLLLGCARQREQLLYPVPTLVVREGAETGFDLSVYKSNSRIVLEVLSHPSRTDSGTGIAAIQSAHFGVGL